MFYPLTLICTAAVNADLVALKILLRVGRDPILHSRNGLIVGGEQNLSGIHSIPHSRDSDGRYKVL